MVIQSGGNVGIGTTTPGTSPHNIGEIFTVYGNGLAVNQGNGTNSMLMGFYGSGNGYFGTNSNNNLVFRTNNSDRMTIDTSGNVGIGTTTPTVSLEVGPNTGTQYVRVSGGNSGSGGGGAFLVGNSTTNVFDMGNYSPVAGGTYDATAVLYSPNSIKILSTFSGGVVLTNGATAWASNSDQRLKTNITPLSADNGLSAILKLNPVTFNWKDAGQNALVGPQTGFIAQEVQQVFPQLVSESGTTTIKVADGTTQVIPQTLGLNYAGLVTPLVKAVQEIANLSDTFKQALIAWLADAQNGIHDLYATVIHATTGNFQQVCLANGPTDQSPICVTKTQLAALLSQSTAAGLANPSPAGSPSNLTNPTLDTSTSTPASQPPVISINGDNPATIHVGDTYADLGVAITAPQSDLNLGIKTYLNGTLVSNIVLDTTQVATDTIDYVATDPTGLSSTSTRQVIIDPLSPPPTPIDTSTTTATTTTTAL